MGPELSIWRNNEGFCAPGGGPGRVDAGADGRADLRHRTAHLRHPTADLCNAGAESPTDAVIAPDLRDAGAEPRPDAVDASDLRDAAADGFPDVRDAGADGRAV